MADIFGDILKGIGEVGEKWTYGPMALRQEKREEVESQARLAAEKARQASWESKNTPDRMSVKDKIALLKLIKEQHAIALNDNMLPGDSDDKKLTEYENRLMQDLFPSGQTPEQLGQSLDKAVGQNRAYIRQRQASPTTQMAVPSPGLSDVASSWLKPDAFTGYIPPPPSTTSPKGALSKAWDFVKSNPSMIAAGSPLAGAGMLGKKVMPMFGNRGTAPPVSTQSPPIAAGPVTGIVPNAPPGDLYLYTSKLDPASKAQLVQILKEGDPAKIQAAYDRMKAKYAPLR